MSPKEQLIERWTKSLDDNAEQQLHAMGMLHETIDPESAELASNLNTLKEVTPTQQKHRARALLFCAGLAVILFCIIAWNSAQMYPTVRSLWKFSQLGYFDEPKVETTNPEEKFLLYGDTTRTSKADQIRALWEREPNNPAYYAEYARYYYKEKKSLPMDFLKTAKRIDPDNGWFLYFAACDLAKDTTEQIGNIAHPLSPISVEDYEKLTREDRANVTEPIIYEIKIKNTKRANQALLLWRESLTKPRYDSYDLAMHCKRYPILSKFSGIPDLLQTQLYTQSFFSASNGSPSYLSSLLAASLQNQQLSNREIEELMKSIDKHIFRSAEKDQNSVIHELIVFSTICQINQQIRILNPHQIDPTIVETWKKRETSITSHALEKYLSKKQRQKEDPHTDKGWEKTTILTNQLIRGLEVVLTEPIRPHPSEIAPLRYAEHSFTMRIVAVFFSIIVMLFFPFNLAFPRRKPLLRLGAELWPTIPWSSHVKLFSWSLLVPISYFACLYWFTPLAGKDTGFKEMFLVPYVPAACVGLIMLVLPRILIHHSTKHWEMMGQQKKSWSLVIGWLCLILALIPMHAMTLPMLQDWSEEMLYTAIGFCTIPSLLWLIINGLRERFSRQPYRRVMHALRRTMLLPCSAASIVVLVCTIFALQSMETYWVKKDTLLALSPDAMAGGFEARVMKALDREQRQALGLEQE